MNNTYQELIPVNVHDNSSLGSKWIATQIRDLILNKQAKNQKCILGLATGSTPILIYKELVRMHREEGLSFKNVITFNLDEYYPMPRESLHSYWYFMHENLLNHIDIDPINIHIPDGRVPKDKIEEHCRDYEQQIINAGGIDLQLLGIGSTGHIGFNEPGSSEKSKTRLITLDRKTRSDAASSFYGIENVPLHAITMGVGTILSAKRIIIAAFTEGKTKIAQQVIEGPISNQYPATFLQRHSDTTFVLEKASANLLTRFRAPWLLQNQGLRGEIQINYDLYMAKKAVIWLSQKVNKSILRLTHQDYEDNGLIDLVSNGAGVVNLQVFKSLSKIITGWPGGGRPDDQADSYFSERKATIRKKIIIFSPHPDDDVICMGGTMKKLVQQGHEVHVAYMVTGNLAVFDSDALRFADFLSEAAKITGGNNHQVYQDVKAQISSKQPGDIDGPTLQFIKTIIRRTEARQAAQYTGVQDENIHFLDLPFYDTGLAQKKPLGPVDIKIVGDLLASVNPDMVYAAGDLTDPHGTHRVCLEAVLANKLPSDVLLYRGAWQEWELEKVSVAVPLSPDELYEKRLAIFKHQSQKDRAMFPGADTREFWQRSESRNRDTAKLFTSLGMVNYEALECFVSLSLLREQGEL